MLLIQRGEEPFRGSWTLPGGYVEADEAPDVAVVREVFEETGLRTGVIGLIGLWHIAHGERHGAHYVFGLALDGPVEDLMEEGNGSEIQRAALLSPEEFEQLGDRGRIALGAGSSNVIDQRMRSYFVRQSNPSRAAGTRVASYLLRVARVSNIAGAKHVPRNEGSGLKICHSEG